MRRLYQKSISNDSCFDYRTYDGRNQTKSYFLVKRALQKEVRNAEIDSSLFSSLTGWSPQFSLEEGLKDTYEPKKAIWSK